MSATVSTCSSRRKRRTASALAAVGATGALLAGVAAPAHAAEETPPPFGAVPWCAAGSGDKVDGEFGGTADCTEAEAAVISQVLDQILGALGLDLDLTALNGAGTLMGNTATVSGTGHTTAIALLADADARADDYLSGALSLAFGEGSKATSHASFGSLATAFSFGGDVTARSLPLGIALVSDTAIGGVSSATAAGGFALAQNAGFEEGGMFGRGGKTVCTALYAEASISNEGRHTSSCKSVLFIFQQSKEGDGPVVYAIKNPLDLALHGLVNDEAAAMLTDVIGAMNGPAIFGDVLGLKLVPEFQSDLIRIELGPNGPKLGTGLGDWFGRLAGKKETAAPEAVTAAGLFGGASGASGSAPTAAAAKSGGLVSTVVPTAEAPKSDAPALDLTADTRPKNAPTAPAPTVQAPVIDNAPAPAPVVESAPAVQAPAAPVVSAPTVATPQSSAPTLTLE